MSLCCCTVLLLMTTVTRQNNKMLITPCQGNLVPPCPAHCTSCQALQLETCGIRADCKQEQYQPVWWINIQPSMRSFAARLVSARHLPLTHLLLALLSCWACFSSIDSSNRIEGERLSPSIVCEAVNRAEAE